MSSRARVQPKDLGEPVKVWAVTEPRGSTTRVGAASTPPPDTGALSGLLAGLSFVGGVAAATATADVPYPRPGSGPTEIRRYFRDNPGAARISVAGQLVSAASLARFTASVAKLAARSGRGHEGCGWWRARRRVAGGLGGPKRRAHRRPGHAGRQRRQAASADVRRRRADPRRRLRPAGWGVENGRAAHERACPAAGDVRPGVGRGGRPVAALLCLGARRLVDTSRAVLGAGRLRRRRGSAALA